VWPSGRTGLTHGTTGCADWPLADAIASGRRHDLTQEQGGVMPYVTAGAENSSPIEIRYDDVGAPVAA
jgi:hypothetical protein